MTTTEEKLLLQIIETDGIKKIQDAITAVISGTPDVNVTDRWARQLGLIDLSRVLGAALSAANPVITGIYDALGNRMPSMDAAARPGYVDVIDRAARVLGTLSANTGVDIGDVDVASIVPGIAATNLGKAEDAQHASGDVGVMALAIRDDTLDAKSGAELDYEPLHTDSRGALWVRDDPPVTYDHAVFDASASGNLVAAVAGKVIKVHAITIQAAGTVVVNINDGSGGASLAEWTFQAREGAVISFAPYPAHWYQTSVNTALYVTLSAAVVVTINVIYTDDDSS